MTLTTLGQVVASVSRGSKAPGGIVGSLLHVHGPAAYALIGALVFAEAALLVGFFIPGETAAVVGGVLAALHHANLGVMMAVIVICAIVGDSVGFEVGARAGGWLLRRRPLKDSAAVEKTMGLLERNGGPAVLLGRFLAFARAVIPGLAGFSGLRYRTFLLYNAIGGIVWGIGYSLLGYVVGVSFEHVLRQVGVWSAVIIVGLLAAAVVIGLIVRRRRKDRGQLTSPSD